jgi:non-homologous end joining protein Ku
MGEWSRNITLTFGLISEAGVKLTNAIDTAAEKATQLHNVCDNNHPPSRVKQSTACPVCKNDDRATFKKAHVEGDVFTLVDADAVAELRKNAVPETLKKNVALTAHPVESVLTTTKSSGSMYYLAPGDKSDGGRYALIRDLIEARPDLAFVAEWCPVSRASMFVAHVRDGAIVLEGREAAGHVRATPTIVATSDTTMLGMAEQMVDALVTDFDATTYEDTYATQLAEMLASAESVTGTAEKVEKDTPLTDADLMAKLAEMVQTAKPKTKTRKKVS